MFKISVVIPHYKDNDRLILLLDELKVQSLSNDIWEVIVVNNDIVKPLILPNDFFVSYPLKILEQPKPGSYAARNMGIKEAKGQIIAFTDSDCIPDKDWLKLVWEIFSHDFNKKIGIMTGPVPLFFKDPKCLTDAEVYEKYTGFTTEAYAQTGHAITANWFSYKSVVEEFGGFNDNLKSNGDSELSGKICTKYKIVYNPNLVVRHPARYCTQDLVNKYKRLIGGTYSRKYQGRKNAFRLYVLKFFWRRYRFAFKKVFTTSPKESMSIIRVCQAINQGVFKEYYHLVQGGETKR